MLDLVRPSNYREPAVGRLIPELDGVRGLAITIVIAFHCGTYLPGGAFKTASRLGWSGVDLFFVLSGFLITGILIDTKGRAGYYRSFFARRFLRIFPLYYLALAFFFFGVAPLADRIPIIAEAPYWGATTDQLWFWAYLQNWYVVVEGTSLPQKHITHFWSLAVEEQFYLLWPFVVAFTSRRSLTAVCIGLVVGAMAFRLLFVLQDLGWEAVYRSTVTRVDTLALGALLAIITRSKRGLRGLAPHAWWIFLAAMGLLAGLIIVTGQRLSQGAATRVVGFACLATMYAVLVLAVMTFPDRHPLVRLMRTHPLRWLGKVSYSLYIFHFPICMILYHGVFEDRFEGTLPEHLAFFAATLAVSGILAAATWRLIEAPILRLKRHFQVGPAPSTATEPVVSG